jgi:uncharacterized protein (TIGR02996 family)
MDRETSLLMQLAERPDDRALRLVFADWLQEQGDPRGEVIALFMRGDGPLALSEQRRVARITLQHAREWLGPLVEVADLYRTRFEDGFLTTLVTLSDPGSADVFDRLAGDPRLATVKNLSIPPAPDHAALEKFLSHRFLGWVSRLELGSNEWRSLRGLELPHLRLERAVVASWGSFEGELAPLDGVPAFTRARTLGLSTTDFTNAPTVQRIVSSVALQLKAVEHFSDVQLHSHYGPVEGSADWLVAGDDAAIALPKLESWSLEASEVGFSRVRGDDRRLSHLVVDLSLPEATVAERQTVGDRGRPPMVMRLHTAAMVMSLLRGKRIKSVEIKLAPGGRLRTSERHTLFTEAKRWGTLERFVIGDETTILP